MRIRLTPGVVFKGAALIALTGLLGTTLPESYPLSEALPTEAEQVDAALEAWLATHSDRPSAIELDVNTFENMFAKEDPLTTTYLRIARDNAAGKIVPAEVGATLKTIAKDAESKRSWENHPLAPQLYYEILRSKALAPDTQAEMQLVFDRVASGTCSEKRMIYDAVSREQLSKMSDGELQSLVTRIDRFRSHNFKRNTLRKFIGSIPENRRAVVTDRLLAVAQPYPAVINGSAWLRPLAERAGKLAGDGPASALDEAREQARKRLCSKAKGTLVQGLAAIKKAKAMRTLNDAVGAARAIEGCYRARSPQLRTTFWKNLTPVMADTYGLEGWAEAKLRLGYIHWSANEFEPAKTQFQDVITKIDGKEAYRSFDARAVYALARVAENEGDMDRAAMLYKEYVSRFAGEENHEEAMMASVLIYASKQDWDQAMAPLETLIAQQTALSIDNRSTGALSFALFWAGRIHLERSQRREAAEMWRRAASEYYSTYYGAISHYMLEQLVGRRLRLQPVRTPAFRPQMLKEGFAPADQARIARVETLMRLGLRDEAICELEELDTADGRPEKMLVKALMLHATGEWLDAIKAYDALPRSFRNTLAVGFERILFPRRYETEIRQLAARAEVDPHFVMAIIRQESVFNPMARSSAGAMGLMQLMPATAKVEAARLGASYIPAAEKRAIRQSVSNPLNLLVADTNLKLGIHHVRTLLGLYKGPVYVLSAYNASPSAARRWMTNIPTDDILAFIERIPYKETRAYVKLVLRNYFYYKRWYGEPDESFKHLDAVTSTLIAMTKRDIAVDETPTVPQ